MLTKDWFERNIEYGQSEWYSTTIEIGKYSTVGSCGACHALLIGHSLSVNVASTVSPCAASNKSIVPAKLKLVLLLYLNLNLVLQQHLA